MTDGPNDLTYTIDRAERVAQIAETGGQVLKVFTFGTTTGNSSSDYRNGKLVQAQRYNYPALGGITHTALVTESYVSNYTWTGEPLEGEEPTPVDTVENVWCTAGHDPQGVFFLAHIVATAAG